MIVLALLLHEERPNRWSGGDYRGVHAFEDAMAGYAVETVRATLVPLTWQSRTSGLVTFALTRVGLAAGVALRWRRSGSSPQAASRRVERTSQATDTA